MSTTRPIPRISLNDAQLRDVDSLLHAAVRARGLPLVEPVADLVRHFRVHKGDGEGIPIPAEILSTIVNVADAACRAGGLGMGEIAVGLLHMIRASDELAHELEAERLRLVHAERMDPTEDAAPESIAADVTHVESVPPEDS